MYGGVAQILHLLVPACRSTLGGRVRLLTLALLLGGGYERIERLASSRSGCSRC